MPFFQIIAIRYNIIDAPDGKLKDHKAPVAYLGGVAIFTGLMVSLAIFFPFETKETYIILPITLLLLLGLVDDIRPMSPLMKLLGQAVAAVCFVRFGFVFSFDYLPYFLNVAISFLWFLTVVNAYNLVDIMDGLAISLGISAVGSFLVFSIMLSQHALALFLVILIGTFFAFLYYNRDPAVMYLGDAGSMLVGGCVASIPFLIEWTLFSPFAIVVPLIIVAIPLLEISQLIVIRTIKGIPFYRGSKDHFAIYLMNNGWSKIAIIDYVFALSIALFFISYWLVKQVMTPFQLATLIVLWCIIWTFFLLKKI